MHLNLLVQLLLSMNGNSTMIYFFQTYRYRGYFDLLNVLCEYISNRYPYLVIEEALKPSSAVINDPLHFLKMHLDLLHREAPLSTGTIFNYLSCLIDFIKWLLTKLIITSASPHLREEVVSNIRMYARDFVSYFTSEKELSDLSLRLITQLKGIFFGILKAFSAECFSLNTVSLWNVGSSVPSCFESDKLVNMEKSSAQEKENTICTLL